jgi:DNA-binding transcriptional LysR family regulator
MIDRYLVRYFLAVVDSGNFTRAAQRMHVTQPTLSIGIAKLEELVGASLFDRNNKRVNLTDAGARFQPFARRIESEFTRSLAAIQDVQPSSVLKLGILNTISSALVQSAIAQMLSADPTQRIEVVDGTERELVNGIGRGRINVALTLVGRGEERFREEILFEEGYVAALPRSHPEAGKSDLKAEALAGSVMIVRRQCEALSETSRYFTERGVRPFFAYRSSQDDRVMAMVAAGLGMTVVPESHACSSVWQTRLTGFDLTRKIGLMFSPDVNRTAVNGSPAFQKFREAVCRRN